jgi:hypothetical protein
MRSLREAIRLVPAELRRMLPAAVGESAPECTESDRRTLAPQYSGRTIGKPAIAVDIPLRTVSAPNTREHWAVRAKRVRAERQATNWMLQTQKLTPSQRAELVKDCPVIRMTRLSGPRGKTLDDDNLRGCLKAPRDAVAEWLGIDDADKRITWAYDQRPHTEWAVRVEIFI